MEERKPAYKRVLIKISGEALAGERHFGLDFSIIKNVCEVIRRCLDAGVEIGMVVGGSIIIETIFNIPGMGSLMLSAINQRDYPVIMGVTLVTSVFVCICNLLVDIIYSLVDPQIRSQFISGKRREKSKNAEKEAAA